MQFSLTLIKMETENFYIVLPSNVQPNFHPENTASSYRTTFDQSYDLSEGEWEVALSQITYVNSLYNIINEGYELQAANYPLTTVIRALSPYHGSIYIPDRQSMVILSYDRASKRYHLRKRDPTDRNAYYMYIGAIMDLALMKFENPESLDRNIIQMILPSHQKELLGGVVTTETIAADDINIYAGADELPQKPAFTINTCFTRSLEKGYYKDASQLCQALSTSYTTPESGLPARLQGKTLVTALENERPECGIVWGYDEKRDRVIVHIKRSGVLTMKNGLHEILGFKTNMMGDGTYIAQRPPLLNRGIYNFFIYCSICAPVQVGNVKAPLLQTIEVEGGKKWGTPQTLRFTRPIYIPVNTTSFNSIQIEIRDDTGELIHFGKGKTTVTLHLRRRRSI